MKKNAHASDDTDVIPSYTYPAPDSLLWEVLPNLYLNIVQTASLCGISVRQLGYWTKQEYVSATGRGARRMYGLDSLRRILAIKRAMTDGATLRQALRALPELGAALPSAFEAPPQALSGPGGAARPLSREEENALAGELLTLFKANRGTRDSAAGLAVKVGRGANEVQTVAEILSRRGHLSRTIVGDEVVFQQLGRDGS